MPAAKKASAISVIIPVLNEQNHLAAAVNSVLGQKYSGEIEVLLALGPSRDNTNQIAAELAKAEFPHAQLLVRAFDRQHVLELRKADVRYLVRETFESAMSMGREALLTLGAAEEEADEVMEHLRRRDAERMDLEAAGGPFAGRALVLGNQVKPAEDSADARSPA